MSAPSYLEVDHDALDLILRETSDGDFIFTASKRHGIKPGRLRAWMEADPKLAERVNEAAEEGREAIALRSRRTLRGHSDEHGGDSTGDVARDKLIVEHDMRLLALYDKRWNPKQEVEHKVAVSHDDFVRKVLAAAEPSE